MFDVQEVKIEDLKPTEFIDQQAKEISNVVGEGIAINALSGGVDSSAVTMIAHKALGLRLKTYFIDNGIMREGEPEWIVKLFKDLGVEVELIDSKSEFFAALKGLTDPEEKRQAITDTFYKDVFSRLVKMSGAKHLLQGTNYTDVEETLAGVKRQHNILEQLGIDTQAEYGYKVIEPLIALRKTGVRAIAKASGLPEEIFNRPPFPGPALAARIIGEVTPKRVEIVRKATKIVEDELASSGAFQYLAILHQDRVTGVRDGRRDFGLQIEIRCWESKDARIGKPTRLSFDILEKLGLRITSEVPGVVSATYNVATKPPSTIEAI